MRVITLLALAASLVDAQNVIDTASFGQTAGDISPNRYGVPHWHISGGTDWKPDILSDRVILTPPYPGNRKGAIWSESPVSVPTWSVDVDFRAGGQEHGSGNFQVWYTKENQNQIAANNVHTVNKFEGLVVVVDQHGGAGGMIRAFLNDGSIDYANHHHIEALAFGHCYYAYRNLGRTSKLTLLQDEAGFEVKVDDRACFRSNEIILPSGNYFGMTATSSETPDSFEVFKFVTREVQPHHSQAWYQQWQQNQQNQQQQGQQQQQQQQPPPPSQNQFTGEQSGSEYIIPDALASKFKDQTSQFEDIHGRVQAIAHQVDTAIHEIHRTSANVQGRMEELHHAIAKQENLNILESRILNLENRVEALKREQKDWTGHFNDIHASLKARHDTLLDALPNTVGSVLSTKGPNIKLFIFLVLGFQALLAAAYVVYKRRLAQGPKKYL